MKTFEKIDNRVCTVPHSPSNHLSLRFNTSLNSKDFYARNKRRYYKGKWAEKV